MPKRVFEQVKWFFADEAENIIAETIKGINEEEQAIDELSLKVPQGRYILGYEHSDGARLMFKCSRQIVQGYGYQQHGDDCPDSRPDNKQSIKYWSNAVGDLFNPHASIDSWETTIQPHELPKELQTAFYNLWSDDYGSRCHLVEYAGRYGIALINDYEPCEEEMIEGRAEETRKLLEDRKIPYLEACADREDRELIVILPWNSTKKNMDKVADFLYKSAYDKSYTYENYKEYKEMEKDEEVEER